MAEELNIREESFPPYKEADPTLAPMILDVDGIADAVAEEKATRAVASGAWEKAAQPGFEESAKGIALDAQVETAHEVALLEDQQRTMEQEDQAADSELDEQSHDGYDDEDNEDPLAGDVDKWVHPDETRTDEQIAHDEKYKVDPY